MMFRSFAMMAVAAIVVSIWPDPVQAQRGRYGRGGVFVRSPGVSVGVGNYYGGQGLYGNPYSYNRGYYGNSYGYNRGYYGYSPYYSQGWYGRPGVYVNTQPYYNSGYASAPVIYGSEYPMHNPSGVTTSFYNGGATNDMKVRVRVLLPDPNARLMVQDQLNEYVGIERDIISPVLQPNTNYHYVFRATWRDVNGQEITREKKIDVVPGQQYTVDFNLLQDPSGVSTSSNKGAATSDMVARIRVLLPDANARLMVQDQVNESVGIERSIVSPILQPNTNYQYVFRATWRDANGQEVTREKKIDVVPGQQYTVDFNLQ